MKLFVWDRIKKVSDEYHEDGGLLIIAESEKRARQMAKEYVTYFYKTIIYPIDLKEHEKPTLIRECEGPEFIITFPDSGCC